MCLTQQKNHPHVNYPYLALPVNLINLNVLLKILIMSDLVEAGQQRNKQLFCSEKNSKTLDQFLRF